MTVMGVVAMGAQGMVIIGGGDDDDHGAGRQCRLTGAAVAVLLAVLLTVLLGAGMVAAAVALQGPDAAAGVAAPEATKPGALNYRGDRKACRRRRGA
jgi:hypothetical protein